MPNKTNKIRLPISKKPGGPIGSTKGKRGYSRKAKHKKGRSNNE